MQLAFIDLVTCQCLLPNYPVIDTAKHNLTILNGIERSIINASFRLQVYTCLITLKLKPTRCVAMQCLLDMLECISLPSETSFQPSISLLRKISYRSPRRRMSVQREFQQCKDRQNFMLILVQNTSHILCYSLAVSEILEPNLETPCRADLENKECKGGRTANERRQMERMQIQAVSLPSSEGLLERGYITHLHPGGYCLLSLEEVF